MVDPDSNLEYHSTLTKEITFEFNLYENLRKSLVELFYPILEFTIFSGLEGKFRRF